MGLIQNSWNEERCRIEEGIFFANDTAILISRDFGGAYVADAKRIPLTHLIANNGEDGYFNVNVLNYQKCGDFLVRVGDGSYEGEGFVALFEKDSDALIWIVHLLSSESFSEIEVVNNLIKAHATYYPHENTIEIPIHSPQSFKFIQRKL